MATAQQIVDSGWYLSGIVARDYEVVSGSQSADGLEILNDILSEMAVTGKYQPYYTQITQNVTKGSASFFVTNLIDCDSVTFKIQSVTYTMNRRNVTQYFNKSFVNSVESLPYEYYFQREVGGGRIFIYYSPSDDYDFRVSGRFSINIVESTTDLSSQFDQIYLTYLKYACAVRMCQFDNVTPPKTVQQELFRIRKMITKMSPSIAENQNISILGSYKAPSYGRANLTGLIIP